MLAHAQKEFRASAREEKAKQVASERSNGIQNLSKQKNIFIIFVSTRRNV